MLNAIKFYLDLPAKSVVVENIKRYNCGDLSMFFCFNSGAYKGNKYVQV